MSTLTCSSPLASGAAIHRVSPPSSLSADPSGYAARSRGALYSAYPPTQQFQPHRAALPLAQKPLVVQSSQTMQAIPSASSQQHLMQRKLPMQTGRWHSTPSCVGRIPSTSPGTHSLTVHPGPRVQRTTGMQGPKAVLWLHGLGDVGDAWRDHPAFRLPGVEFYHPTAPKRYSPCNGRSTTSWFDIQELPLLLSEPENPRHMDTTVAFIHKTLDDLEKKGTSASDVVLGGFSQGGAVSMLAGLSYPKKLAGIVSISGWCSNLSNLRSWIREAGRTTPVLICCGDGDPVVDISASKTSADMMRNELGATVDIVCVRRGKHQPTQEELQAVTAFMKKSLRLSA